MITDTENFLSQHFRSKEASAYLRDNTILQSPGKEIKYSGEELKQVGCNPLRYFHASLLPENAYDIRMTRELLGHHDVKTRNYTHVLNRGSAGMPSLVDGLQGEG